MTRIALALAAVPVAAASASVAYAKPNPPTQCDIALTNPNAIACAGYYTGNLINGSPTDIVKQQAAIASLPGAFTFDGNWAALDPRYKIEGLKNGNQLNFGTKMFGQTIIGAHFGNVAGPSGNVSVFWLLDLGSSGADYISLDDPSGFSNAVLYTANNTPPLPEPSTWLMMIVGFGAIGYSMRAARRQKFTLRYG